MTGALPASQPRARPAGLPTRLIIRVGDDGPGIPPSANLFVPFFTTKTKGSGIGLALCRQIAEGHGGSLLLANRADTHGAEAVLVLPRE